MSKFPTIAVMIPMNEDHCRNCDPPSGGPLTPLKNRVDRSVGWASGVVVAIGMCIEERVRQVPQEYPVLEREPSGSVAGRQGGTIGRPE